MTPQELKDASNIAAAAIFPIIPEDPEFFKIQCEKTRAEAVKKIAEAFNAFVSSSE
jgi:hypothetical protein